MVSVRYGCQIHELKKEDFLIKSSQKGGKKRNKLFLRAKTPLKFFFGGQQGGRDLKRWTCPPKGVHLATLQCEGAKNKMVEIMQITGASKNQTSIEMSTKFMTKAATTAIPKTTPKSNKN